MAKGIINALVDHQTTPIVFIVNKIDTLIKISYNKQLIYIYKVKESSYISIPSLISSLIALIAS